MFEKPSANQPNNDKINYEGAVLCTITTETLKNMSPERLNEFLMNVSVNQLNRLISQMTDEDENLKQSIKELVVNRSDYDKIQF